MQTLIIVLGVGLGGGVIIFMSAALSGLLANIVRRTLNYAAPIVIQPPDEVARPQLGGTVAALVQPRAQRLRSIDQWQKLRGKVARVPGVTAVTSVACGLGFALRGDASRLVSVTGIEPDSYLEVIALSDKIVSDRLALGTSEIALAPSLSRISVSGSAISCA